MRSLLLLLGCLLGLAFVLALITGFISPRRRLSGWKSPLFRLCAWKGALAIGRVRTWLGSGWRPPILALLLAAMVSRAVLRPEPLMNLTLGLQEHLFLAFIVSITGVWLTAYFVRRRIFVPAFQVHGNAAATGFGEALAARLRHALAGITSVHRTIDEALPSSDGRVSSLEVSVEDIGEELEATVGSQLLPPAFDRFKIGPLLARATGFLRGPHLQGHLHQKGSALVLTVELSGGGKRGSWSVTNDNPSRSHALQASDKPLEDADQQATEDADQQATIAYQMVRQMAYQIAASVASLGSPRWEALLNFTEGLRAYRKVRLTHADRDIHLREAERCFREALQADNTFSQGHYNLGVVYSKLGEDDAALASFRRAIQADPSSFSAHLALAMAYFDRAVDLFHRGAFEDAVREDFLQARVFSRRAIDLAPSEPRPRNVYAAARMCEEWKGLKPPFCGEEWKDVARKEVIYHLRVASALSWRRMCRQELTGAGSPAEEAKVVTLICLENLAEVHFEVGDVEQSLRVLQEAGRVSPRKPSIRLAMGKCLAMTSPGLADPKARFSRLENARAEFYEVHGDGLPLEQRVARWAWLLVIHSELLRLLGQGVRPRASRHHWPAICPSSERNGVERAFGCALDCAVPPEDLVLARPERVGVKASPLRKRYSRQLELLRLELRHVERYIARPVGTRTGGERATAVDVELWNRLRGCLRVLDPTERGSLDPRLLAVGKDAVTNETDWRWKHAQRAIRRARDVLYTDPGGAADLLNRAIRTLRRDHCRQIRSQGLETLLAQAYLLQADPPSAPGEPPAGIQTAATAEGTASRAYFLHRALDFAHRSVAASPQSGARRLVLAQIHDALRDHHMADGERRAALSLAPPVELLGDLRTLGEIFASWQQYTQNGDGREEASGVELRKEAIELFDRLRRLLEASAIPAPEPKYGGLRPLRFLEHAAIHYHLGKLYRGSGEMDKAIENLGIALASNFEVSGCQDLLESIRAGQHREVAATQPGVDGATSPR